MTWIIALVALSLVMGVLAIAEFRQPIGASAFKLPDRVFVIATFTIAFIYSLALLAAKIAL